MVGIGIVEGLVSTDSELDLYVADKVEGMCWVAPAEADDKTQSYTVVEGESDCIAVESRELRIDL